MIRPSLRRVILLNYSSIRMSRLLLDAQIQSRPVVPVITTCWVLKTIWTIRID